MQSQLPLYPEQASNFAPQVDALMVFIIAICVFFAVAVTLAIIFFLYKFRRKSTGEIGVAIHGDMRLESAWIVVPLVLLARLQPCLPARAQWCTWISGARPRTPGHLCNRQTVDVETATAERPERSMSCTCRWDKTLRLIMGSEDVIHDFSVPAFRVKMDVVPGRYNTLWFRPTKTGKFHFYCSQYCGTNHAIMGGWVTVMEPDEYTAWLSGSSGTIANPVLAGEKLFAERSCLACHASDGKGRGPSLNGFFGGKVKLADGSTVTADEEYIRESFFNPSAKIVAGYQPLMPSYQGQLTEEQTLDLISYVKSLQAEPAPSTGAGATPSQGTQTTGKK